MNYPHHLGWPTYHAPEYLAVVIFCIGVIVQTAAQAPSSIYGGRSQVLSCLLRLGLTGIMIREVRHGSGSRLSQYGCPSV